MHADFVVPRLRSVLSPLRDAAVIASIAAALSAAPAAHAQFSSLGLPTLTEASSNAGGQNKTSSYFIGFYPIAPFEVSENFSFVGSGGADYSVSDSYKEYIYGFLLAPEATFSLKNGKSGYGFGGWYWEGSGGYGGLYDVHGKYFFTPQIGLQAGYLGSSNGFGNKGPDAYLTYTYSPASQKNRAFNASVGLGAIDSVENKGSGDDYVYDDKQTTFLSGFLSAGCNLTEHFSLNASYWVISGSQTETSSGISEDTPYSFSTKDTHTLSRFALGVGCSF